MADLGGRSIDGSPFLSPESLRTWFIHGLGVPENDFDQASGDLVRGGVLDSLALAELIEWLNIQIGRDLYAIELSVENFRTIEDILATVARAK